MVTAPSISWLLVTTDSNQQEFTTSVLYGISLRRKLDQLGQLRVPFLFYVVLSIFLEYTDHLDCVSPRTQSSCLDVDKRGQIGIKATGFYESASIWNLGSSKMLLSLYFRGTPERTSAFRGNCVICPAVPKALFWIKVIEVLSSWQWSSVFLYIKRKDRTLHSLKQQCFCQDQCSLSLDFDLRKLYFDVASNTFLIPKIIAHFYSPLVYWK